jgi:hypothetical protein
MSCDRTEYRLLLHAHDALGWWERWHVDRHLKACPGCREQRDRFAREKQALAGCLVSPPAVRVADRVALELGVPRPDSGPRLVMPRRLQALVMVLVAVMAAGAAVAYVQWRETPGGLIGLGQPSAPPGIVPPGPGVCHPVIPVVQPDGPIGTDARRRHAQSGRRHRSAPKVPKPVDVRAFSVPGLPESSPPP